MSLKVAPTLALYPTARQPALQSPFQVRMSDPTIPPLSYRALLVLLSKEDLTDGLTLLSRQHVMAFSPHKIDLGRL